MTSATMTTQAGLQIGYTLMTEQSSPTSLVDYAVRAEAAGFDILTTSDHMSPWIDEQGHAPNAWVLLGAVAQATSRIDLMTYVTCPIMRYHPAVVAQQAATVQILSGGRFTLGLGAGENLNEHVVGDGWPPVNIRHDMFEDALEIITRMFDGGYVSYQGGHLSTDSAKLWDLPQVRVPIGIAVSGPQGIDRFAPYGDVMIAVEPDPELAPAWDAATAATTPTPKIGQLPISWGADRDEALRRAHEQFRWFAGGWKVNAELPGTPAFAAASQFVRPEDVAQQIPCGDDLDAVVEAVGAFAAAGFTGVSLVQIGDAAQDEFFAASDKILSALRGAFPIG